MENESEQTYSLLFQDLKARGVQKVWLCVSDAHKGLQAETITSHSCFRKKR
jgi:putative transposase